MFRGKLFNKGSLHSEISDLVIQEWDQQAQGHSVNSTALRERKLRFATEI